MHDERSESSGEDELGTARSSWERAVVGAGLILTALLYLRTLGTPSLWLDEAWEANYYVGITDSPWYNRPILYMLAVRAIVGVLGPGEFALRLLPCLAGIATLAATYVLARRRLGVAAAVIAAGSLAVAPPFLFAAHELKHYTLDALFTCLLLLTYDRYRERPDRRRLLLYLATAVASFGFSFSSVFVVAALFVVEACATRLVAPSFRPFLAANVAAAIAFASLYFGVHAAGARDPLLVEYFAEHYAPPAVTALPGWTAGRTQEMLEALTGVSSGIALAPVLLAGFVVAARGGAGTVAWSFPLILVFNAAASVPRLYPYGVERLSLYLAPVVCILFATAFGLILSPADGRWSRRLLTAGVLFALLYPNLSGARTALTTGWHREHIRDLVATLVSERRPGEGLYVNEDAEPAFRYYWFRNGRDLDAEQVVWGERHRASPELHAEQVSKLSYTSFWALLTHISPSEAAVLRRLILERYDCEKSWVVGDARLDFYRLEPAVPAAP